MLQVLEDKIITFVKEELKRMQNIVNSHYPESLERQSENNYALEGKDEEHKNSRESFVKITLNFMRMMKLNELADELQSSKRISLND